MTKLEHLSGIHRGSTITILGKGPSRDLFEDDGFPIIGINHHWHYPLYCDYCVYLDHQMDRIVRDECPEDQQAGMYIGSVIKKNPYTKVLAPLDANARPGREWVNTDLFKTIPSWGFSMIYAIQVAIGMGAESVNIWGLDLEDMNSMAHPKHRKYLEAFWPLINEEEVPITVHTLHYTSDRIRVVCVR